MNTTQTTRLYNTSTINIGSRVRILAPASKNSPADGWTGVEGTVTDKAAHDVLIDGDVWVHAQRIEKISTY